MEKLILKHKFYALKSLLIVVLVLGGILTPFFNSLGNPSTIFEDDFEDYYLGNLAGQGGWSADTGFKVVDTQAFKGTQSISYTGSDWKIAQKTGNDIIDGRIVFYDWLDSSLNTSDPVHTFDVGISGNYFIATKIVCISGLCYLYYWNGETSAWVQYTPSVDKESWNLIEIEWNCSTTDRFRVRANENSWSEWVKFYGQASMDYANIVRISTLAFSYKWYIDYIAESSWTPSCSLEYCHLCTNKYMCTIVGCEWYWSMWEYRYYCVAPYEIGEEECGAFFKCRYCMSQANCEAQVSCVWEDRGLGNKCYTKEPTIPPEQVGWEVPELEDCSELSGVEKWLCEIKNFGAGIFVPSQAKVNDLFSTLGAFKQKFPFNYVIEIQSFFSDVKDSLEDEKSIPIKILGQEKNVDFSFWSKTGEVGGVSETIKNVLFDFTTLILVIGFLTWLLAFVRRFWT